MKRWVVISFLILMNCGGSPPETIDGTKSILYVKVFDEKTEKPVKRAIVYLGTGYWKSYTNKKGECVIKGFPFGDYSLGVFKKGYERFTRNFHFKKGKNYVTVRIRKKEKEPESVVLEGKIIEIVTGKGTRSENHYFMIVDKEGKREYIFNELGENKGFERFVNKEVEIKGFKETGFIGWEHKGVKGIYVEKIMVK